MSCPKCGTSNVRVAESGFFFDDYVCENGHCYETWSRVVKTIAVGTLATVVLGPIAGAIVTAAVSGGDGGDGASVA